MLSKCKFLHIKIFPCRLTHIRYTYKHIHIYIQNFVLNYFISVVVRIGSYFNLFEMLPKIYLTILILLDERKLLNTHFILP